MDLSRLIAVVLSDLDERVRTTDAQVHVGALPTIVANPLRMRQLFQNLIANALKFHRAGVPPVIRVSASAVPAEIGPAGSGRGMWEFHVEDDGVGFDEEFLDRLFQPFQRLHGRHLYEGTGMGLAICRRIVEGHGGVISARSRVGAGTAFLFTLSSTSAAMPPSLSTPAVAL